MKFKLLRGTHSQREPDPSGEPCHKCDGKGRVVHLLGADKVDKPCTYCLATGKKHISKEYHSKDPSRNVVISNIDLVARFGFEKFQNMDQYVNEDLATRIEQLERENAKLRASVEQPEEEADLDKMTLKELREYAEQSGIELESGLSKAQVKEAIEAAFSY